MSAVWCQYDASDASKGRLREGTIASMNATHVTMNWGGGFASCDSMPRYMVGKPPGSGRVACAQIPDSCAPSVRGATNARCLHSGQCVDGHYCCPFFKTCMSNSGGAFQGNWARDNDPIRYNMVWGNNKHCSGSSCDICGIRPGQTGAGADPMGLCNGLTLMTGASLQMTFYQTYDDSMGFPMQAFDPSHSMCNCHPLFVQMLLNGTWVEDVGTTPTCPSDPPVSSGGGSSGGEL